MLKKSIPAFVEKTWSLLESGEFSQVICWNEQGDSFRIVNDFQFQHTVLPHYFKHSNLTSFQRQLNMYNFHKKKTQNGHTEYHHRLFRRNQRQLLLAIRRKPSEDQIQIGEQLLRKLQLEHEETHHDNQVNPVERNEEQNSLDVQITDRNVRQNHQPEEPEVEIPTFATEAMQYHPYHPFACYYMANPYPLPYYVAWTPQRKIKTHVLIQSPIDPEQFNWPQ